MDLESIILNAISEPEKDKYYMISLTCGILKSQAHRERAECWPPRAGDARGGELLDMGHDPPVRGVHLGHRGQ